MSTFYRSRIKSLVAVSLVFVVFLFSFCSVKKSSDLEIVAGVSKKLAENRKSSISSIVYDLNFNIPSDLKKSVKGEEKIYLKISDLSNPLILDFTPPGENIKKILVNDRSINIVYKKEHIIIDSTFLKKGNNMVKINFIAGDLSLNRNKEFLYTLFVPDRARTAFPCFDQPDLKSSYKLTLEIPESWTAVANGKIKQQIKKDKKKIFRFYKTKPLSTYLFAFVAGKFKKVTKKWKDQDISIYHRETDKEKIKHNINDIFELVFHSLNWLEKYTQIDYPFAKYDLVAIPSFQYGGMEHTGATLYRASRIFLDKSSSLNQKLNRANLIAHETSHMWFGDLVTMKWFDEVWLKEVFANFIADKIVNPMFPEVNHKLRFLLGHYPSAYSIDRTEGRHPIIQPLDNLKDAGTVYGKIIYHKAPIVMSILEKLIGEKNLKIGLRGYLETFSYGNASWADLINILNTRTEKDLDDWSQTWVYEAGMPYISIGLRKNKNGEISFLSIEQKDSDNKNRVWTQPMVTKLFYKNRLEKIQFEFDQRKEKLNKTSGLELPLYILQNGDSKAYGFFKLDSQSKKYLLENFNTIEKDLYKGNILVTLWENMLNGLIEPEEFIKTISISLKTEENEQIVHQMLSYLETIYWKFLTEKQRKIFTRKVENILWNLLNKQGSKNKVEYFETYQRIALSKQAINRLILIWEKKLKIPGLELSQGQFTELSFEIAIRDFDKSGNILEKQLSRIKNPDKKERMKFIIPALSGNKNIRDKFFESLKNPQRRKHEPWVETALHYLHHPLRADSSTKYILPSLKLLKEIQETGDIFFPIGWTSQTLWGHNSSKTVQIIRRFLKQKPDYPRPLKLKILQSADNVFRASKILNKD